MSPLQSSLPQEAPVHYLPGSHGCVTQIVIRRSDPVNPGPYCPKCARLFHLNKTRTWTWSWICATDVSSSILGDENLAGRLSKTKSKSRFDRAGILVQTARALSAAILCKQLQPFMVSEASAAGL